MYFGGGGLLSVMRGSRNTLHLQWVGRRCQTKEGRKKERVCSKCYRHIDLYEGIIGLINCTVVI